MTKYATIVVSNRLPVSVKKVDDELQFSASDGGLATAVSSLDVDDMIWIGWPGIASDDLTTGERATIRRILAKSGCYPVFLSAEQIELFYEGYANDTLWPLMHYFESYMVNKPDYWVEYQRVNRQYLRAIRRLSDQSPRVWVHDYQLMLLPQLLRRELPDSLIGYFHHIPFPSYETFRLLPERRQILEGLLGADLIGFHVYDYARHFLSSCLRLLGHSNEYGTLSVDGRQIHVDALPISIDYDRFDQIAASTEAQQAYNSLRETYTDQKMLFSVDRLDYSKGIIERLEGFREFLIAHPRYIGRISFNMVVSPSRTGVEAYQQLQERIEQTIGRINGEFGTAEWSPIVYQFHTLPIEDIVPLYMAADVMLVTPMRDGMNLVAKESVAAKRQLPGVLVLSEMAGAIDELPEAIAINPNDVAGIATAIAQALTMPVREQKRRLQAMQERIAAYPVARWGRDYLSALDKVRQHQQESATQRMSDAVLDDMAQRYQSARTRLIVLDYDGTLQTFKPTPDPAAAAPSRELHQLLSRLSSAPGTTVSIVSGRTKEALESWFGDTNIELVAEHGAWVRTGSVWQSQAADFGPARQLITPILDDYMSRTPGSRIEHKDFASVWHYRNASVELGLVRSFNIKHELRSALADTDMSVHSGNKIVEIKPSSIGKASALHRLLEAADYDFVMVAGDDYTDEDMINAAPDGAITIKVGSGDTAAQYRVDSVSAMVRVLHKIVESA